MSDLSPDFQDRVAQITGDQVSWLKMLDNQRGSLLIIVGEAAELEMDPFLRTEFKDGLDLDTGLPSC